MFYFSQFLPGFWLSWYRKDWRGSVLSFRDNCSREPDFFHFCMNHMPEKKQLFNLAKTATSSAFGHYWCKKWTWQTLRCHIILTPNSKIKKYYNCDCFLDRSFFKFILMLIFHVGNPFPEWVFWDPPQKKTTATKIKNTLSTNQSYQLWSIKFI